jgi:hypothetical protein
MLEDVMLYQCLIEAEARKNDISLPIEVRIRSFETYNLCLQSAADRGYDLQSLKEAALMRQYAS